MQKEICTGNIQNLQRIARISKSDIRIIPIRFIEVRTVEHCEIFALNTVNGAPAFLNIGSSFIEED
jgi:hypothetical protein